MKIGLAVNLDYSCCQRSNYSFLRHLEQYLFKAVSSFDWISCLRRVNYSTGDLNFEQEQFRI